MEAFLTWLQQLSPPDTIEAAATWQRTVAYSAACVVGPIGFGVLVAGVLTGIEKVFGIKLSSKGH